MIRNILKNLFLTATIILVALGATNTAAQNGPKTAPASVEPKRINKTFSLPRRQYDLMRHHLTSSYYLSGAPYGKGIILDRLGIDRFIETHWLSWLTVNENRTVVNSGDTIILPAGNYHQFALWKYTDLKKNGKIFLPFGYVIGIDIINPDKMTGNWNNFQGISLSKPVPGEPGKQYAKVTGKPNFFYLLVREVRPDTCNEPDRPEDAGKQCGAVWGDPAMIIYVRPNTDNSPPKHTQAPKPSATEYEIEENSAGFPDKK